MMTDPIADMLTRIRNAIAIDRNRVDIPLSKVKRGIAEVLKREGYIADYEVVDTKPRGTLRLQLKYGPDGERVIQHIERVSKPGRRVYKRLEHVVPVLSGIGIEVISTSRGILSDRECRKNNVGGEVLARIW